MTFDDLLVIILHFIQKTLEETRKFYLMLDNALIHTAKEIR